MTTRTLKRKNFSELPISYFAHKNHSDKFPYFFGGKMSDIPYGFKAILFVKLLII